MQNEMNNSYGWKNEPDTRYRRYFDWFQVQYIDAHCLQCISCVRDMNDIRIVGLL